MLTLRHVNPKSNKRYDAYTRVPAFEKIQHDTQIGVSDQNRSLTEFYLFQKLISLVTDFLFAQNYYLLGE